jgi:hypothetical protein
MSQSHPIMPATPCRTCGGMVHSGLEFCSPECYEEYEAATKPCPDCHHVGWDCVCDDVYVPVAEDDLPMGDYYDDGADFYDEPW